MSDQERMNITRTDLVEFNFSESLTSHIRIRASVIKIHEKILCRSQECFDNIKSQVRNFYEKDYITFSFDSQPIQNN